MAAQLHIGNTTKFQTTVTNASGTAIDISGVNAKQFWFEDPAGNKSTAAVDFTTDGTDGVLELTNATSLLDEAGEWQVQSYVTWADGTDRHGPKHKFTVHRRCGD
jgi:hypothetical protein